MRFDDKQFLAEQIKLHRKKANLTQEELAERVDLSTQHISRIETGCYIPSLKSFFLIAQELNIDLRIFGYNVNNSKYDVKNQIIEKIISANDAELILYENLIDVANKSLLKIKQTLF